jgi:proline dehydrogenase
MLRAFLIYLSQAGWARRMMSGWGLARRVSRRFVAGETEDEAIAAIRALNAKGITATVDILGESVTDADEANAVAESYLRLLDRVKAEGVDSTLSAKLTALGLDIDYELCLANMRRLLDRAREHGLQVTIDMEGSDHTQRTLDILYTLFRDEGYKNVRGVLQSYLYRTDDDAKQAAELGIGIRLCKGAYREPASIAYPKKADVNKAFERHAEILLDAAKEGRGYPGIATHDEKLIEAAKAYAAAHDIPLTNFEFQMLHGIRTALQDELARDGYRVRIYVPFGSYWYPYFMRRLAERPANLWFFMSNLIRR